MGWRPCCWTCRGVWRDEAECLRVTRDRVSVLRLTAVGSFDGLTEYFASLLMEGEQVRNKIQVKPNQFNVVI